VNKVIFEDFGEPLLNLVRSLSTCSENSHAKTSSSCPINSVAVLPFVNVGDEPKKEGFSDGLADEIINALTQIDDLKVAARTSSFSFKGKDVSISEIGKSLNVNSILEGSVRKSGSHVRVIVQLVNVLNGYHLWSKRFDVETKDIFAVQDEITLAIVDVLKIKLLGKEKAAILKRHTTNALAYESYLDGRYFFYEHTSEGWLKSIECFEKAINLDPNYAPAYAGLSSVLAFAWYFGSFSSDQAITKWQTVNVKLLEIGDDLVESHIALGRYYFYYEWNWKEAENEYLRAIEINPNVADAHQQYGLFLTCMGRFDEAVNEGKKALELEPLSLLVNFHVGWIFWFANQLDDALELVQIMKKIDPNFYPAYWIKGSIHTTTREFENSIKEFQKAFALGGNQNVLAAVGSSYGLSGKKNEALEVINQMLNRREKDHITAMNIAKVYGSLGENDRSFEWLEKSFQDRDGDMVYLKVLAQKTKGSVWREDFSDNLRFSSFLERLNLPKGDY
jgi:adenylate cyclase